MAATRSNTTRIETRGNARVLVVREIAAGDEQHLSAGRLNRTRNGIAQRERGCPRLAPHHHRNNRHARQEMRKKRQLHLERVFASVRRRHLDDRVRRLIDPTGKFLVHLNRTERRFPGTIRPDRHALERHEVRRPDEHDRRRSCCACRAVGVRANRTGVHQSCVRRHDRARRRIRHDIDARQMRVELRDETHRIVGIPACQQPRRA